MFGRKKTTSRKRHCLEWYTYVLVDYIVVSEDKKWWTHKLSITFWVMEYHTTFLLAFATHKSSFIFIESIVHVVGGFSKPGLVFLSVFMVLGFLPNNSINSASMYICTTHTIPFAHSTYSYCIPVQYTCL